MLVEAACLLIVGTTCLASQTARRAFAEWSAFAEARARRRRPIERLPRTVGRVWNENRVIRRGSLVGRRSCLLFVRSEDVGSRVPVRHLEMSVGFIRTKLNLDVYLVCIGQGDPPILKYSDPVLIDDRDGYVSNRFRVQATPTAYEFDANGAFARLGSMKVALPEMQATISFDPA